MHWNLTRPLLIKNLLKASRCDHLFRLCWSHEKQSQIAIQIIDRCNLQGEMSRKLRLKLSVLPFAHLPLLEWRVLIKP